jgi:hypothetical protein
MMFSVPRGVEGSGEFDRATLLSETGSPEGGNAELSKRYGRSRPEAATPIIPAEHEGREICGRSARQVGGVGLVPAEAV